MKLDLTNWDEEAYRRSILQEKETQCRTVFRAIFAPSPRQLPNSRNPNPDVVVAASSDGLVASYSLRSCLSSRASNGIASRQLMVPEPNCFIQAHDGPAYDVKFYGDADNSLLLSCGDDGRIRGWKWNDMAMPGEHMDSQGASLQPVLELENPQHKLVIGNSYSFTVEISFLFTFFGGVGGAEEEGSTGNYGGLMKEVQWEGNHHHVLTREHRRLVNGLVPVEKTIIGPWGALSPIPENNAMAIDKYGKAIYAAAGDSCAYCWDLETRTIKTIYKGHSDYLHCIVTWQSGNQIITGSEDGTARIWDCRSGKCVHVISPRQEKNLKEISCISSVALDSNENWLAFSSGRNLYVWNLLAREQISMIPTHTSIQDVLFVDNEILAVGAEPLLSRFDLNGKVLSQIQCAPQSAFSVSLHPSGVAAVAGYGGLVDVISQFGSHLCTFRCKSA